MCDEQDRSPLRVETYEAIHELLKVALILSECGFIENNEYGAQGNARYQRGVAVGGTLIDKNAVARGNWEFITAEARRLVTTVINSG